jgi:hypothetical protein
MTVFQKEELFQVMDQVETLLVAKGWPVPFTPYCLVDSEPFLSLLDRLRDCLKDRTDIGFANTLKGEMRH